LSDEVFEVVMGRAEQLADVLALQGVARIDAFVHRATGDLVLIEVDVCPSLAADSLLYQQVSCHPYLHVLGEDMQLLATAL
jgi:D-alanine-D-alanine ligase-like ATP-grasp enzyme